jgi:hypothetical protein
MVGAGDDLAVYRDIGDAAGFNLGDKLTVARLLGGDLLLVEEVEQQDHGQTNDQPQRQVFVETVQGYPPGEKLGLL